MTVCSCDFSTRTRCSSCMFLSRDFHSYDTEENDRQKFENN